MVDLEQKSKQIRRMVLESSYAAKACHIGSALSAVDILVELFYGGMMKEKDQFIFSKASGASAYYAILADLGYFPKEKLAQYLHDFPECSKEVPGVLHSVGSVGMGLSVAAGMAFADRTRNVYCLISDGECQEGVTWEVAMFAAHHKLNNLIVICDRNKIQACGSTEDIIGLEPLATKWLSFGWNVVELDGHNLEHIKESFGNEMYDYRSPDIKVKLVCDRPRTIIAETIKGKGVARFEDDYRWHYKNVDSTILAEALEDINNEEMYKERKAIYLHHPDGVPIL